jgi:prolyl 4-hydroxylase
VVDASGRSDLAALSDDAVDISAFRNDILRGLRIAHEKFAGVQLVAEQVVGLQIFSSGERIPSHYGRLGIDVITSVIQVAEDVDEPWPFVLERDGRTDDVYLGVGQMLLLESSTVSRARPIPLNGRSVITLMTSFRPLDWPWSEDAIIDRARVDGLAIGVDRREVRPTI